MYLSNVWQNRPLIFWTRLIAVTFVTTGRLLHADDQPASSDGYKTVPVTVGGKTVPVRVKEASDPFKNVSSSNSTGKYDPERIFSATSSMANKKFSLPSDSLSKSNSDFKNRDQDTFVTKAYAGDASSPTAPNLNTKAGFPTTSAYSRNAAGFDKSYATSNADAGQTRTALLASATSADQNRTAVLGGPDNRTFASPLAGKTFQGPEAERVRRHLTKMDNGQIAHHRTCRTARSPSTKSATSSITASSPIPTSSRRNRASRSTTPITSRSLCATRLRRPAMTTKMIPCPLPAPWRRLKRRKIQNRCPNRKAGRCAWPPSHASAV